MAAEVDPQASPFSFLHPNNPKPEMPRTVGPAAQRPEVISVPEAESAEATPARAQDSWSPWRPVIKAVISLPRPGGPSVSGATYL